MQRTNGTLKDREVGIWIYEVVDNENKMKVYIKATKKVRD